MGLATALAPLNSTMLVVALPRIIDDFEVSLSSAGAASGVYATSRYLGSIFGSTLLAASANPTGRGTFIMVVAAAVVAALIVTRLPQRSSPLAIGQPAKPAAAPD